MSERVPRVAVGLVHFPVYDKAGSIVCTNVTNLDVHDIARACRTYNVEKYYVIHPMKEQNIFVSRILDFWRTGTGSTYNPHRKSALSMVQTVHHIEEAVSDLGESPIIITTTAKDKPGQIPFRDLRKEIWKSESSYLLLFGTGYGMAASLYEGTQTLEPIKGFSPDNFRHLSVRSAVSICLDRLLGAW